ncbi:MAG: FAD-dependent monooxygenase [Proteobacteria bacterium]|nr:FAD-dependent monooxygenase [Pseudomonadota bacterium]
MTLNIAIVGGGIGGLTTAIALRKKGFTVTLFEQAPEIGEVGAGLQISVNAVRVLNALGLQPQNWVCSKPKSITLHDYKDGRMVANVAMNSTPDAPYLQFHRADLIDELMAAATKSGAVIKLGQQASVVNTGAGSVTVDGQSYDLVVGADGVRSTIRDQFYDAQKPQFTRQIAWRALVCANDLPNGFTQNTHLYMGPNKHMVTYPLRDGKLINIVAVEERNTWTDEGWNHPGDADELRRLFSGWCGDVTTLLAQVKNPIVWGLFAHPTLHSWVKNRLVLLGDSAHPMVPFVAQGACMAIEDAWVLADQLAKGGDINTTLQSYQSIRKPRATKVQETALKSGRIYHTSNPLARGLLHTGMRLSAKVAPDIMAGHYDWIYDHDVTAG